MNRHIDSAQIASLAGTLGAYFAANYDKLLAAACAAAGLGYTLWKWRRESRQRRH